MRITAMGLAVAVLMVAACGGTEQGPAPAASPDVTGLYTFNQYLFFPFDQNEVGQTGLTALSQDGAKVSGVSVLRFPVPFPASLERDPQAEPVPGRLRPRGGEVRRPRHR